MVLLVLLLQMNVRIMQDGAEVVAGGIEHRGHIIACEVFKMVGQSARDCSTRARTLGNVLRELGGVRCFWFLANVFVAN